MSRRKQSNPKPLKRKSEDLLEAVAKLHNLPQELLSLRDPEDECQEYTIFTKVSLNKGFLFGTYSGYLLPPVQNEEVDEVQESPINIIQARNDKGKQIRIGLTDDLASWLKLLRLAPSSDDANISVYLDGTEIWCTITKNIAKDHELQVTWQILDSGHSRTIKSSFMPSHLHNFKHFYNRRNRTSNDRSKSIYEDSEIRKTESNGDNGDSKQELSNCKNHRSPTVPEKSITPPDSVKYERASPYSPMCAASPSRREEADHFYAGGPSSSQCAIIKNSEAFVNGFRYPEGVTYGTTSEGEYCCPQCETKFNSIRTLQIHQLYYCVHRLAAWACTSDTDTEDVSATSKNDSAVNPESPSSEKGLRKKEEESASSHSFENNDTSSKPYFTSAHRAHRVFKCPYCRYSSDKKACLTRHVRMHGSCPNGDGQPEVHLVTPPLARYCANCDIQFASFKNYHVHKQFYCRTRHVHKSISPNVMHSSHQTQHLTQRRTQADKPDSPQETNFNALMNQPLYAAISTSPLILVPCSYVAGGGLSPAAGLIPTGNIIIPNNGPSPASPDREPSTHVPNVIPTYTVIPQTQQPNTSEDSAEASSSSPPKYIEKETKVRRHSEENTDATSELKRQSPSTTTKTQSKDESETPLDLSFRKRSRKKSAPDTKVTSKQEDSPNALLSSSTSSSSNEDISQQMASVPLPPFPVTGNPAIDLPALTRTIQTPARLILDPRSTLAPATALKTPQMMVKQGTSKCKECNIVFYKRENYIVHKNLYCAARLQKSQSQSPDANVVVDDDTTDKEDEAGRPENTSSTSPVVPYPKTPDTAESSTENSNHTPPHPSPVFQFYCIACGIKFTSIDNLTAHQTYYCPKREITVQHPAGVLPNLSRGDFRCPKCKNMYLSEESLRHHPCLVQRKCPYCDVYCPTLSAAQRHLVTHTGVKSFRCSLCGYKGHTLRGMRTHIRIHLDKNNTTPEEAYILCVDEGGLEIGSVNKKPVRPDRLNAVHDDSAVASLVSAASPGLVPADILPRKSVPDIVSEQVVSGDITHWCQICGYSSSYKGNVVRHVKLVHKELMSTQSMASIVNSRPSSVTMDIKQPVELAAETVCCLPSDRKTESSSPLVNGSSTKSEHKVTDVDLKTESPSPPLDTCPARKLERSSSADEDSSSNTSTVTSFKTGPKYCKICDISFNYLSNFIAHKKFYCRPGEPQDRGSVQPVQ